MAAGPLVFELSKSVKTLPPNPVHLSEEDKHLCAEIFKLHSFHTRMKPKQNNWHSSSKFILDKFLPFFKRMVKSLRRVLFLAF